MRATIGLAIASIVLIGGAELVVMRLAADASSESSKLADDRVALERLVLATSKLDRGARAVVRGDPGASLAFSDAKRRFDAAMFEPTLRHGADGYAYALKAASERYRVGDGNDVEGRLAAFDNAIAEPRGFEKQLDAHAVVLAHDLDYARDRSARLLRYAQILAVASMLAGLAIAFALWRKPRARTRRETLETARNMPVAPRLLR